MSSLPLAVTVGFSGPRSWFSYKDHPDLNPAAFQAAATDWLKERLATLPAELGLADHHFLTGISQIAIGADHAFTAACRDLGIPQIISLPLPSDAYLDAHGTSEPDFSPEEKQRSLALLASPHIIQERVVAEVADRHARFEEANIELVRQSDIIIAMVKPASPGQRGGTRDVIDQAKRWNTPVLIVTVDHENGTPTFQAEWEENTAPGKSSYQPPIHPEEIEIPGLPTDPTSAIPAKDAYFAAIKNHTSTGADRFSKFFQNAAKIIIGTHFAATVCAVLALVLLDEYMGETAFYLTLILLLTAELAFLIWGYRHHSRLHKSEAASRWALNRLLSEVARSAIAFGKYHVGFAHLRVLDLPASLHPLLRTMEILQLRETRAHTSGDWRECRDTYLTERLTKPNAQLDFYARKSADAGKKYHHAHKAFTFITRAAIAATALKLLFIIAYKLHLINDIELWKAVLGFFGVLLPVIAVAALSLAAANDLEARSHTFTEMLEFLEHQAILLKNATSEREFSKLLTETESRLLGETVTWFSRRSFTGVA